MLCSRPFDRVKGPLISENIPIINWYTSYPFRITRHYTKLQKKVMWRVQGSVSLMVLMLTTKLRSVMMFVRSSNEKHHKHGKPQIQKQLNIIKNYRSILHVCKLVLPCMHGVFNPAEHQLPWSIIFRILVP